LESCYILHVAYSVTSQVLQLPAWAVAVYDTATWAHRTRSSVPWTLNYAAGLLEQLKIVMFTVSFWPIALMNE